MVVLKILGPSGHETHKDIKPEQAKEIIEKIVAVEGDRFFIVDRETHQLVKELTFTEDQQLMMIPKIEGG